jgi:hypothetical protein
MSGTGTSNQWPSMVTQRNNTSGTVGANFGTYAIIELENGSGTLKEASRTLTKWVSATANAERSTYEIWTGNGGAAAVVTFAITGYGDISSPTMRVFASDAAADADATLPSKAFYKITGDRSVFQKP